MNEKWTAKQENLLENGSEQNTNDNLREFIIRHDIVDFAKNATVTALGSYLRNDCRYVDGQCCDHVRTYKCSDKRIMVLCSNYCDKSFSHGGSPIIVPPGFKLSIVPLYNKSAVSYYNSFDGLADIRSWIKAHKSYVKLSVDN